MRFGQFPRQIPRRQHSAIVVPFIENISTGYNWSLKLRWVNFDSPINFRGDAWVPPAPHVHLRGINDMDGKERHKGHCTS